MTDIEAPSRQKLLIDSDEPMLVISITDSENTDPSLDKPSRDKEDPKRAKLRNDRAEPRWRKSQIDNEEPIRPILRTDNAEPR